MKPTINEKLIAYLTLLSGLSLSAVAVYYSVAGLTAIFAAAIIPIMIMGVALEVGKIVATVWLKQNWKIAPWTVKTYLCSAIAMLMVITSMGIFGFLSKAHSDQNLVSGDVQSKIAIYDEKIKTAKDNIDADRKQLKQMDEAVDQVMGRSTDEKGADKAVALRRGQAKDRARLLQDIEAEQKKISGLNEERAPIAAEVRKVEAEVGPIKYIAAFVYGDTDQTVLEKAVTWVIILIIVVFDPLALILLIASQISFQNFREREDPNEQELEEFADAFNEEFNKPDAWVADVGKKPTEEELKDEAIHCHKCDTELVNAPGIGLFCPNKECDVLDGPFEDDEPKIEEPVKQEIIVPVRKADRPLRTKIFKSPGVIVPLPEEVPPTEYVQNEEQKESNLWSSTVEEKTIGSTEYQQSILSKREEEIKNYAYLVRTKRMQMSDVPLEFHELVKRKV